ARAQYNAPALPRNETATGGSACAGLRGCGSIGSSGSSAMADIVLGIGTSHTPQISVPWAEWPSLGRTTEPSPHTPDDIDAQLQPETFKRRHAAAQAAIKQLSQALQSQDLDAIVIFGDDQHEQVDDGNMP